MDRVNVAVIGVGRMGGRHADNLLKNRVKGARLAAVCDISDEALKKYSGKVARYRDYKEMLSQQKIEAVVIATPHYEHGKIAIYCIEHGINVLIEKPLTVTTAEAKKVISAANENPLLKVAVMFNQRTSPLYKRAKALIESNKLGKIQRVNYIITDWYRSQAYYDQGGWRATLAGEGGGTLINQCVHQLDLLQWITNMPISVQAECKTVGRKITTENDVTATLEYDNGAMCSFTASTHELHGTNRLEIACEKGRIVVDKQKMTVTQFGKAEPEVNATTRFGYGSVTIKRTQTYRRGLGFALEQIYGQQIKILRNFINAQTKGEKLISPVYDGLNAVELINGFYLSSWTKSKVLLPIDDALYESLLTQKVSEELSK